MAKVRVEWLDAPVLLHAEDRIIQQGEELDMEKAEAQDRQAVGQVRIIADKPKARKGEND